MKKIIFGFFMLLSASLHAQNSINAGFDLLVPPGLYKGWGVMPNVNFALAMGEKWSFLTGVGFHYKNLKETHELYSIQPGEMGSFESRNRITGLVLMGEFKKYFGMGNNEEGGFYLRFGLGYNPMKYHLVADVYDTTIYQSGAYYPGEIKENNVNSFVFKLAIGFDKEIVDLLNVYCEVGAIVFMGNDYANSVNIGIRKRFFSL